jgi:ABC-type bacteriocin/lantibiotic exporter with double-glycine peptidase domain
MRLAAALLVTFLVTGCLYQGSAVTVDNQQLRDDPHAVRVEVPLVRQEGAKDCGPAALVSILGFWGDRVTQRQIRQDTGVPSDESIAAGSLQKYLTRRGYDSFLIAGTLRDLRSEIDRGRPVLVGMLKPYAGKKYFAHYEVVTGISSKYVYTMNPEGNLARYPITGFEREWRGAKHLTLLIAPRVAVDDRLSASTPLRNHGWQ